MPRKKIINVVNDDGSISQKLYEIPEDQYEQPVINDEELMNSQPLKRKEFIDVLKSCYNEIYKLNDKIINLENIITQHNQLLKDIIKNISK